VICTMPCVTSHMMGFITRHKSRITAFKSGVMRDLS
jgi:hypothetical protein